MHLADVGIELLGRQVVPECCSVHVEHLRNKAWGLEERRLEALIA